MLIYRKKLYSVENKEGDLEEHFKEIHLTFKSKNQSPLIMIIEQFYHRKLNYANVIGALK